MDSEPESEKEQAKAKSVGKPPGRGWTERLTGSIRYRRFTDIDAGGRPSILFKFELAPGQNDLPQAVYDVLNQMKHLDGGSEHGGGNRHTGLTFNRSKKHGRVWRLPDDPTGRTAADIIDAKLSDLAATLDSEQGQAR